MNFILYKGIEKGSRI